MFRYSPIFHLATTVKTGSHALETTVNTENIKKLIKHLEGVPSASFDMTDWFGAKNVRGEYSTDRGNFYLSQESIALRDRDQFVNTVKEGWCGTAGYIAGHAYIYLLSSNDMEDEKYLPVFTSDENVSVADIGEGFLGLNPVQSNMLFIPARVHYANITTEVAIKVLTHLLETGNVDWYTAAPEVSHNY